MFTSYLVAHDFLHLPLPPHYILQPLYNKYVGTTVIVAFYNFRL